MPSRQLDLFIDRPPEPPYQSHSATSAEAAHAIEPRTETLRKAVLDLLRKWGDAGGTDEEVHEYHGGNPGTYRARRVELVEMGLVRDSGRTRPTRSGRQAVVWIAIAR